MRLLVSWLRDFVDIAASPRQIADTLGLRGFEVASVDGTGGDAVIDFEVTANRPDCLSVIGLAREVATAFDLPFAPTRATAGASIPAGESDRVRVTIEDAALGPRYAGAVADVAPGASSPAWLASRLEAAGIRPIGAIVDVTNYVLIERGHPMHAFDLSALAGAEVRVRRAANGETITTLDGVRRTLEPDMLVIADRDRAQAVAGVMGGAASEVSASTRTILFESAYFKPASVRRTSKRLNLKTEASSRFERGADVNGVVPALQRAIALMDAIGAGRVSGPIVDVYPEPRQPATILLRRERLTTLLGVPVPDRDVERILPGLGLAVERRGDGWLVTAPTFRVDLKREVDLIEEVGRHYGFDKLPSSFPVVTEAAPPPDPRVPRDRLVRHIMSASGLTEAVTFGFIEEKAAAAFAFAGAAPAIPIANPLSAKFDTLRPSLIPGLVDVVAHNRRHGRDDVRVYEIGARFSAAGESRGVAAAWTGRAAGLDWSQPGRDVDFFDLKGVVERLADALEIAIRFERAREAFLVPGQAARILCAAGPREGAVIGIVGQVAPAVADARGLPRHDHAFVAEFDLDLAAEARMPHSDATRPLPRYPFVVRDLSIVVPDALPASTISGTIQAAAASAPAPLVAIEFFDRYRGKGVPEGSVSLSVRLTFQSPDRTLTDEDVQRAFDTILSALAREHRAMQR